MAVPPLPLTALLAMPLTFLSEVGPLLLFTTGIPLAGVLLFYLVLEPFLENRQRKRWLKANRTTMRSLMVLAHLAGRLRERVEPCPHCGTAEPEFWEHDRHLLVLRCGGCKRNFTLSQRAYPEIRLMLRLMPALTLVLMQIRQGPGSRLAAHLRHCCRPFTAYLKRIP
ncbi:hypothetical protein OZ410_06955 [Robiginitalea sp. M366]|uniref:hypothetical protein n=1 Tax=Robiginitalea aestuariiviva TaxID=3036903 RepID=UPI00240E360D|nr:hypothetical protein [Robiginitalea aestuariiviva]MDG1572048.1 hypothetical protein [Robiginitalea aestuariiviva]